jgi:hypothetical protein
MLRPGRDKLNPYFSYKPREESGAVATIGGAIGAPGTHIVSIGGNSVGIQVASADTIRVHNGLSGTATGNVTLIW